MTGQNARSVNKERQWPRVRFWGALLLFLVILGFLVWRLITNGTTMVSLLIPFVFILLDYLAFELKMLDASSEKDWSYEPRMKIWGLGVLLGLGSLLLSRWSEIMGDLGSETAGTISKAVLTLGIVGLFIYGVTRLTGED